eukprot:scaffold284637_cov37-Tisochrysis_lutea.AAC.1
MRGPKAQRMRPRVRIVDVVIGAGQLASDEESSSCRPWRGNLPSFGPTWLPCIVVLLATILESPWRLMPPSTRSASYPVDGPHLVEEWSPCTVGKESMKVHVMHRVFAGILFDSRGNTPFKRKCSNKFAGIFFMVRTGVNERLQLPLQFGLRSIK